MFSIYIQWKSFQPTMEGNSDGCYSIVETWILLLVKQASNGKICCLITLYELLNQNHAYSMLWWFSEVEIGGIQGTALCVLYFRFTFLDTKSSRDK